MPATPARDFRMPPFRLLTALACLASAPFAGAAVVVDGRLSPGEWEGARHVTDFRLLQPLTGEPATLATEAWVLATPEGLAVAFRNHQPADVPRTTQRTRRDQMGQQDRVNVMVDFDGDGRTGYDFVVSITGGIGDEVITSERNFNDDWDGHWHSATSQDDEAWYAEILVPWHVAPMSAARDGRRTLGLYLDRVVGSTGERFGWPDASYQRTRFLSEFSKVEVPHFNQALLAVTPYVVASHDIVARRQRRGRGRRPVLEAQRPVPAGGDAQPRFRPGGKRRPGGELQRGGKFLRRQAAVLHREPGAVRRAVRHRQQPPALHAAHRRTGRRPQRPGRRARGGEAQRLAGRRALRRAGRQRRRRQWAATSSRCAPPATSATRTWARC